jgi:hypothetical protein
MESAGLEHLRDDALQLQRRRMDGTEMGLKCGFCAFLGTNAEENRKKPVETA